MPEITATSKFTDVVRWIVNWWNNIWPPVYAEVQSVAANSKDAKKAASQAASSAQTAELAAERAESLTRQATPDSLGLVYSASAANIANGDAGHVIDAEQLKQQFTEKVQQAGTGTAGINTLATHGEAVNGIGKGSVTAELIPGIMSAYGGGGAGEANHIITYGHSPEGFPYEMLEMDDDITRVVKIWGNATVAADEWLDVTLPGELINPSYLGVSGVISGGTGAGELRWHKAGTTNTSVSIGVHDGSNWLAGELSFMIMAQLDVAPTPLAPSGIYVRSQTSGVIEFSTNPF